MNAIYELVEQIVEKKNNVYHYHSIVKCKTCSATKKIWKNDKRAIEYCKMCNLEKHKRDFVGTETTQYTVIGFSHKDENRRCLFYIVKCKKCSKECVMRKDSIIDDTKMSCVNCKGNGITTSLKAPRNVALYYYLQGAKQRGWEWTLSDSEFDSLISGNCYYCGSEPRSMQHLKRYNKMKVDFKSNGIDRLDSNKGYASENCVSCCKICNRMKMGIPKEEFINHVKKMYYNLNQMV